MLGKIMIDIIQANFTPGKIQKIIQAQPAPQFYNKAFGRYDAAIEEGLNTTTQRQMQFAQLLQLKELGVPIPDESLIESSTLQEKNKLIEALQQQKQQMQQQQQMQLEAQMKEQEARTNLAHARAQADQGLGIERISRVQENQALAVERRAAAVRDEETGLLNLVKALKEIDTVDLEHVEKLMALSGIIKQQAQQNEPKMQTSS
jgi:hypothetical protein